MVWAPRFATSRTTGVVSSKLWHPQQNPATATERMNEPGEGPTNHPPPPQPSALGPRPSEDPPQPSALSPRPSEDPPRPYVLALIITIAFFLWHSPLLSLEGRVRGFNSDAAIIGLMGKKLLEGRGFDVFFWGQNYVGPLTSMFVAAAGALTGGVNALALRLGTFVEVLLGIVLTVWAVARVSRRASVLTAVALVITPPVILRMMITPLGAEMAFLMAAALAAVVVQHLTAVAGRGWLSHTLGQVFFGLLAGIGWWMNQQVVFTLFAAGVILALRSPALVAASRHLRMRDRILLRGDRLGWRRLPGVAEAFALLSTAAGALVLAFVMVADLTPLEPLPFIVGRVADGLLLLAIPHLLLPLVLGEWRQWHVPRDARTRYEIRAIAFFVLGSLIGYAPVLLGAIFGWYERTYVFAFQAAWPADMLQQTGSLFREVLPHTLGADASILGVLWLLGGLALAGFAAMRARREPARFFLLLAVLGNAAFFIVTRGGKPHYFISTVGFLLALIALGAVDAWDRRALARRALAIAVLAAGLLSMTFAARSWHRNLLDEPDPMPLLARVEAAGCAVTYADFWVAYRYRLLDEERRAWIPYQSQNRAMPESIAAQKLSGQRCLVTKAGVVEKLDHDLPLKWELRRKR
jgi:hypothetical protein